MRTSFLGLKIGRLQIFSLALIVFGSRLWTFHYAGSPLPFFDQWLAEYNNVFLSLAGGHSISEVLLRHHNEHALITTKLFSLIGFSINGYWDVKFLVVIAAIARTVVAVMAFLHLASNESGPKRLLLWLLVAVIFGIPWSGFNALCGLQVSFYLAEIALIWSLGLVVNWKSPRSAIGLAGAMVFGLGSLASALAIPASTLVAHWVSRKSRPGFWPAWTVTAIMALAFAINATGGHGEITSKLTFATCKFFLRLISWPTENLTLGLCLAVITLISIPLIKRLPHFDPQKASLTLGLTVFAIVNSGLLALNRAPSELHSRHWDTLLWMPLGMIALVIVATPYLPRFRSLATVMAIGVALFYGATFAQKYHAITQPYYDASHEQRDAVVQQYRDWFLSGKLKEPSDVVNRQLEQRDYRFYDDPIGRYMPHPIPTANILAAPIPALSLLSPDILPTREPSLLSRITRSLIACGKPLWLLGVLLGITSLGISFRRRPAEPHANGHPLA